MVRTNRKILCFNILPPKSIPNMCLLPMYLEVKHLYFYNKKNRHSTSLSLHPFTAYSKCNCHLGRAFKETETFMVDAETIIINDYSSLLSGHLKQRTILFENNNIYIRPLFYLKTIGFLFLFACLS